MIVIGTFEAKTRLSALLDKVAQGEEVLITRRNMPVARLVPAVKAERMETGKAIRKLLAFRKKVTLSGLNWRDLRDAGRR